MDNQVGGGVQRTRRERTAGDSAEIITDIRGDQDAPGGDDTVASGEGKGLGTGGVEPQRIGRRDGSECVRRQSHIGVVGSTPSVVSVSAIKGDDLRAGAGSPVVTTEGRPA